MLAWLNRTMVIDVRWEKKPPGAVRTEGSFPLSRLSYVSRQSGRITLRIDRRYSPSTTSMTTVRL